MLKSIFGVLLLVLGLTSCVVADVPQQLYIVGFDDDGADRPGLAVQWQMIPDSEEHADTMLPCAGSGCYYGIYFRYCPSIDYTGGAHSNPNYKCPPNPMASSNSFLTPNPGSASENNKSQSVTINITKPMTYRQANQLFMEEKGKSGIGYNYWFYRPTSWYFCVGARQGSSHYPVNPDACMNIPIVPMRCEISSNSLDLQHGTFNSAKLNAPNTPKSVTGSFSVKCNNDAALMFNLSEEKITLAEGLRTDLRMTKNGQTIANHSSQSIKGNIETTIDITSTLSATGKIAPNSYSASAVLVITAQ